MRLFVFIADGWGAVNGGINCFNYDLVKACAHIKKDDNDIRICCVVPGLTPEQQTEMQQEGIIPITLSKGAFDSPEAVQVISGNIQKNPELEYFYPDKCNTFCVGHDIYTGNISKQLAEECSGWNIVFHHMDYQSYYLLGKPNVSNYEKKVEEQKSVLRGADLVCAVGPMLHQSAEDLSRDAGKCIEVFPGVASFNAQPKYPNRYNLIVFGRVEEDNQAIKQTPLAIDAFAKAISMDQDTRIIRDNSMLWVIGYDVDDPESLTEEVLRLQKEAAEIAGCMCNVSPSSYINDRTELGEKLRDMSVAMMLSFHEGFGLVGYEAIAAGVPLILSKNTGLYMFLEREKLDHLIYPVQIAGSNLTKRYSEDDLCTVAKALRDIRQEEDKYKEKALKLRETLLSKSDKYSWDAVANNFIENVFRRFKAELKSMSKVFYKPDDITKLSTDLKNGTYTTITFDPSAGKHIFIVKGENTLASLVACLQEKYNNTYTISIYNMQDGEDADSAYSNFLINCWSAFGKKDDIKGSGFEGFLGERLPKTILILDNFPLEFIPRFHDMFSMLDKQRDDFYIFITFKIDCFLQICPYRRSDILGSQIPPIDKRSLPMCLTDEQKLIIKILAFREKRGYSKRLIAYICNAINTYWAQQEESKYLAGFEEPIAIENELKEFGLIEEYSEYSYQNVETYLSAAAELEVDDKSYALGLAILGRFYERCYYRGWSRDQQLSWGYFSCKCFSRAGVIDCEIKDAIKANYEKLLRKIRKRAMDMSDYGPYFNALKRFFDEYETPNDPWVWYAFIHCETIYCPSEDTLNKVYRVLETEFPDSEKEKRKKNELYVQLIRLTAELEDELDIDDSLIHLLDGITELAEDNPSGTVWNQCFLTVFNLATAQKKYDLADEYLIRYKEVSKNDDLYPKMLILAMETELKISKYVAGYEIDLTHSLSDIGHAFGIARDKLQDCRAQAWTTGLRGECQILLGVENGEGNLRKAMKLRKYSGEKTKLYKNWLQRISKYDSLQQKTKDFLKQEMIRTGILVYTGQGS